MKQNFHNNNNNKLLITIFYSYLIRFYMSDEKKNVPNYYITQGEINEFNSLISKLNKYNYSAPTFSSEQEIANEANEITSRCASDKYFANKILRILNAYVNQLIYFPPGPDRLVKKLLSPFYFLKIAASHQDHTATYHDLMMRCFGNYNKLDSKETTRFFIDPTHDIENILSQDELVTALRWIDWRSLLTFNSINHKIASALIHAFPEKRQDFLKKFIESAQDDPTQFNLAKYLIDNFTNEMPENSLFSILNTHPTLVSDMLTNYGKSSITPKLWWNIFRQQDQNRPLQEQVLSALLEKDNNYPVKYQFITELVQYKTSDSEVISPVLMQICEKFPKYAAIVKYELSCMEGVQLLDEKHYARLSALSSKTNNKSPKVEQKNNADFFSAFFHPSVAEQKEISRPFSQESILPPPSAPPIVSKETKLYKSENLRLYFFEREGIEEGEPSYPNHHFPPKKSLLSMEVYDKGGKLLGFVERGEITPPPEIEGEPDSALEPGEQQPGATHS